MDSVKPRRAVSRPSSSYLSNRRFRCSSLHLVGLCLVFVLAAWGQAMSYTVQVVAVSSQDRALALVSDLTKQGYPAYLLTVPTPQGLVYRIRIGAFANREAAARYAAALEGVGDSRPTPALAENIPAGLSPLAPALLGVYSLESVNVQVLPWRKGVALRVQPKTASQAATYTLLDGTAAPPSFSSWRAVPQDDGTVLSVYSLSLWPDDWPTSTPLERESYRQTVLGNIATQFGLNVADLEAYVFAEGEENAAPFLVLAERFNPATGARERLKALGRPGTTADGAGPELAGVAGAAMPEVPILPPLYEVDSAVDKVDDAAVLQGDQWQAVAADGYTELSGFAQAKPWRAVVGTPLWARQNVLITLDGLDVLVYTLLER